MSDEPTRSCPFCPWKCPTQLETTYRILLRTHIRQAHAMYYCPICWVTVSETLLITHMSECHDKIICAICEFEDTSRENLVTHIRQEHGIEGQFNCPKCFKIENSEQVYQLHLQRKHYSCNFCPRTFWSSQFYGEHITKCDGSTTFKSKEELYCEVKRTFNETNKSTSEESEEDNDENLDILAKAKLNNKKVEKPQPAKDRCKKCQSLDTLCIHHLNYKSFEDYVVKRTKVTKDGESVVLKMKPVILNFYTCILCSHWRSTSAREFEEHMDQNHKTTKERSEKLENL